MNTFYSPPCKTLQMSINNQTGLVPTSNTRCMDCNVYNPAFDVPLVVYINVQVNYPFAKTRNFYYLHQQHNKSNYPTYQPSKSS